MVKRVGPQVPKLNYGPPQNYCGFLYSNFYMETVEDVLELGLKICCSADSRNFRKLAIATKTTEFLYCCFLYRWYCTESSLWFPRCVDRYFHVFP